MNIHYTTAEPTPTPAPADADPDCVDSMREFNLNVIQCLIADLTVLAHTLDDQPERQLPESTWAAINSAFDHLHSATQRWKH
ncbi:hypothetical protein [Candidatus Contendibacter odensensis]|uniref:Uncharacterized protein n=1 Tax=Candidatus Contendobacter odensis Run_B_J11 TaxID=1400861 RepID=A0A7U7G910_9GAMM|nr:hypothetical protein [Candidatus Contendobacter odensis]CDH43854.1 hypothetical protein BN874_1370019 [Candidatus Contendobacter odensis Run_B_J11]